MTQPKLIWEIPEEEVQWSDFEKQWEDRKDDSFVQLINRGKAGQNIGMSNGLNTINKYINGTHKGRYILIGADSGCFKTTLVDFMYLYAIWKDCKSKGIKLYVKYFSFELSLAEKKVKWASQWIKAMYKIDLRADYIAGRSGTLSEEHFKLVQRAYAVIEEMMLDVDVIDHMLHPTGMLNRLIEEHYEKVGKVIRAPSKLDKHGKPRPGMILRYEPKDPQALTLCIVDHVSLINVEAGATTSKQIIDRWSMYCVQLRNIFQTTIINIQQFSTDLMSAYREQKKNETAIAPQRLDFSESKFTFRDADTVFGLVKPIQFNLRTYHGYNMEEIGQYFVALHLMKNRYGPADRVMPLFVNPIAGLFWDLPTNPLDPAMKFFIDEAKRLDTL